MENSPGSALRVDLRPSPATGCVLAVAHAGAALGAFALPGSPWSTSVACAALAFGAWRSLAHHAFRRGVGAIVCVAYSESGGWWLTTARGEHIGACEPVSAFVHPALSVVSWSTPQGRIDVLFPGGSLSPDAARRLRVALRRIAMRSTMKRTRALPGGTRFLSRLASLARSRVAVASGSPRRRSADAGYDARTRSRMRSRTC